MSSIYTSSQSLTSGKLTAEAAQEQLTSHLQQTVRFIRVLDITILLCGWLVMLLTTWLLGSAVDHWLFALPASLRWLIWLSVVGVTLWFSITQLLPLIVRRINPTYAAKRIEQIVPEFKNGLIAWLELQSMPDHGVPRGIIAALSYRAVRFIGGHDPSATVDTGPLVKRAGALLLLIIALALYAILSPKSLLESGKRMAFPWLSTSAPTRVRIIDVSPGSIELTHGIPLAIAVEVRGLRQGEAIDVCYNTLDGQYTNQRVPLVPRTDGWKYSGTVKSGPIGLEHDIEYWIEAGDATSRRYRISLSPLPSLAVERVRIEYPKYTRLEPREFAPNADIEGLEGSKLQVWGSSNQNLDRARLVINPQLNTAGQIHQASEYIDMKVDSQMVQGACSLFPQRNAFCLIGYNVRGDANVNPVIRPIRVYKDLSPEVQLIGPEDRTVNISPTSRLRIEVRTSDADFGLAKAQLDAKLNHIPINSIMLFENADQDSQAVLSRVITTVLDVAQWKVTAGDTIELVAVVFDNRHDPNSQVLSPNQQQSLPLILKVVAPHAAKVPAEMQPKPTDNPPKKPQTENKSPRPQDQPSSSDQSSETKSQSSEDSTSEDTQTSNSDAGEKSKSSKQDSPSSSQQQSKNENSSEVSNDSSPPETQSQKSSQPPKDSSQGDSNSSTNPSSSSKPAPESESPNTTKAANSSKQSSEHSAGESEGNPKSGDKSNSNSDKSAKAGSAPTSDTPENVDKSPDSVSSDSNRNNAPKSSNLTNDPDRSTGAQANEQSQVNENDSSRSSSSDHQRSKDEETLQKIKDFIEKQQNQESGKQESSKQESSKQESSKQESGKQESGKQESSKQESGKQESSKQESSKQESSKQESGKQDSGKQNSGKQDSGKQNSGKQSNSQGSEGSAGSEGGGRPSQGKPSSGSGGSDQGGDGGIAGSGDPSDPSFAKQTTDLTLDYLKRQRQQPDPELLRELNWTEKDLRDFIDRYQSAKDLSAKAEALENGSADLSRLRLEGGSGNVGSSGNGDSYRNQLDSGGRQRPPDNLRRRVEAFQEALKKSRS